MKQILDLLPSTLGPLAGPAVGAAAGAGVKWYLEQIKFQKGNLRIGGAEQSKIAGSWSGNYHQLRGPSGEPLNGQWLMTLESNRNSIKGKVDVILPYDGGQYRFQYRLTGTLKTEKFLKLEYETTSETEFMFGSVVLKIDSEMLIGSLVGYGSISKKVIVGALALAKHTENGPVTESPPFELGTTCLTC